MLVKQLIDRRPIVLLIGQAVNNWSMGLTAYDIAEAPGRVNYISDVKRAFLSKNRPVGVLRKRIFVPLLLTDQDQRHS